MSTLLHVLVSLLPELTLRERLLLTELFPDVSALCSLCSRDISAVAGRKVLKPSFQVRALLPEAERIFESLEAGGIEVLWFWDREYPPQLREIYDPPCLLYVKGGQCRYDTPLVAVVGTRHPSDRGKRSAYLFGVSCADKRVPVISGLASGIDSAVHSGVVKNGGRAVAVLGNGIDFIYPASSRMLAEEILENGGSIVSEFPPGTPPYKYNFPKRNRIISGLSNAVVIIEAPEKSGALITADYALEQGRSLFVHSCCLQDQWNSGSRGLALDGAGIVRAVDDVLEDSGKIREGLRLEVIDKPEEWGLSELFEAERTGKLIEDGGIYYSTGGKSV